MNDIFEKAINSLTVGNKSKSVYNRRYIKRKIYYQCKGWIDNSNKNFLVITGPRKCGKTVCLEQIKEYYGTEHYYNFKEISSVDERNRIMEEVVLPAKEGLFLLDEITYLTGYMNQLTAIDNSIIRNNVNGIQDTRKFIITGSHSYAIRNAALLALSTNADYLQTSFIDFEEWLLWSNKISEYTQEYEPSPDDFKDYICNSNQFTKINNNLEYIQSCIEETVTCELNLHDKINGMVPVGCVSAEDALSVLYSFLAKLHKKMSINNLRNPAKGIVAARITNSTIQSTIKQSELENRTKTIFEYLDSYRLPDDSNTIRNAIILLQQLDLITISIPVRNLQDNSNVYCALLDNSKVHNKADLIASCNVCVKHPMFYTNIIKEVIPEIGDDYYKVIDQTILGSILECHLKGLFSYKLNSDILYYFEYYNNDTQGEIDLIDFSSYTAYEFSVGRRHTLDHLKVLDKPWKCNLISGQEYERFEHSIQHEYYPNFVLKLSRGNFVKRLESLKY